MNDLGALYQDVILEHARNRHGHGLLPSAAASSHQVNPTCGDEITLQLHVDAEGRTVTAVSWEGHGCVISMASASALAELAVGVPPTRLEELIQRFRSVMQSRGAPVEEEPLLGDATAFAGVSRYPMRIKCAMLAWVACQAALSQLRRTPDGARQARDTAIG